MVPTAFNRRFVPSFFAGGTRCCLTRAAGCATILLIVLPALLALLCAGCSRSATPAANGTQGTAAERLRDTESGVASTAPAGDERDKSARSRAEPTRVKLWQQSAEGVARKLHRGFAPRVANEECGLDGLDAFRVRLDQKQAKGERSEVADFVVGVDPRKNELLISGDARQTKSLVRLIEQIDRGIAEGQAIELQASPHDVGQLAWLYDRVHKRDFVLVEGAPFAIAGLAGMVQAVGKDFVLLEIDGHPRRLEFSQNLRQLKATP